MKEIWKYPLEVSHNILKIPKGGKILSVQSQYGRPCLWVLVDPKAEKENVVIKTFGTGHPLSNEETTDIEFIGTYQLNGGNFIGHVFQVI